MSNPKVLLIQPTIQPEGIKILEEQVEIVMAPDGDKDTLIRYLSSGECMGMITRVEQITEDIVRASNNLKVIGQHGVGVDNIAVEEATRKGILVVNAPSANYISVAEHVIMFALSLSRQIIKADRAVKDGYWNYREDHIPFELMGKRFLCVGFGQIGRETARKLKVAFDVQVMVYDPFVTKTSMASLGVDKCEDLQEGLANADYVSIHAPYNEKTHHLIGEKELALMKKDAYLINCSRGKIIDQEALYNTLSTHSIRGAALDVFATEPLLPDERLLQLDNVIVSPHFAGDTIEAKRRCSAQIAGEVLKVARGEVPASPVNPEVLSKFKP